jgi:hypothetical protein
MMNTPVNPNPNTPMEEIPQCMIVHDANGDKVGNVTFSALRDGYFVVEKGFLFTHELFLPVTAIAARDANGLTLRLTKDDLKLDQYQQPPTEFNTAPTQPTYPNSPMPDDRVVNAGPTYPETPMPNVGPSNTPPPYPDAPMPNVGPADTLPASDVGHPHHVIHPENEPPLVGN